MTQYFTRFQSTAVSFVAALFVAATCVSAAVGPVAPIIA